jgi:uncharacterized protein DUF3499
MQCYLCHREEQADLPRPPQRKLAQVVPGPGFRSCSHWGCSLPAEGSLAHNYAERRAWILDLDATHDPHTYDLCGYHADRFRPPKGWSAEDLRAGSGRRF